MKRKINVFLGASIIYYIIFLALLTTSHKPIAAGEFVPQILIVIAVFIGFFLWANNKVIIGRTLALLGITLLALLTAYQSFIGRWDYYALSWLLVISLFLFAGYVENTSKENMAA